jgi:hypothetical protein
MLQLDRLPISLTGDDDLPVIEETGMSPKKRHEVSRMVAYILRMIRINEWDSSVLRIVDVGAGQVCSKRSSLSHLIHGSINLVFRSFILGLSYEIIKGSVAAIKNPCLGCG